MNRIYVVSYRLHSALTGTPFNTHDTYHFLPGRLAIATYCVRGAVASWLVRSTADRTVRVCALAGGGGVHFVVSWARHFIPTVFLSTQVCV